MVPFENRTAAKERKTTKYQGLIEETKQRGFHVNLNTLEIGSRGMFAISSLLFIDDFTSVNKRQISNLSSYYRQKDTASFQCYILCRRTISSWC